MLLLVVRQCFIRTGTANQTLSWTIPTPSGTQAAVGGFNIYRGATKITATPFISRNQ